MNNKKTLIAFFAIATTISLYGSDKDDLMPEGGNPNRSGKCLLKPAYCGLPTSSLALNGPVSPNTKAEAKKASKEKSAVIARKLFQQ